MQLIQSPINYFNIYNLVDSISLLLNLVIILDDTMSLKTFKGFDHLLGAVSVFLMWFKLLQFLRLFDVTSYYIRLIIATLKEIMYFLLVFVVICLMFGNALYVINIPRDIAGNDDTNLIGSPIFGGWFRMLDAAFIIYDSSIGNADNGSIGEGADA